MFHPLRHVARLLGIARILARHDALFLLERLEVAEVAVVAARLASRRRAVGRPGQRLARALTEAGPSFIKLGQALSTRSDLLGDGRGRRPEAAPRDGPRPPGGGRVGGPPAVLWVVVALALAVALAALAA